MKNNYSMLMKTVLAFFVLSFVPLIAQDKPVGKPQFSCDIIKNSGICADWHKQPPRDAIDFCNGGPMGKEVKKCPTAGRVGGCWNSTTGNMMWHYRGKWDAEKVKTKCSQNNEQFLKK